MAFLRHIACALALITLASTAFAALPARVCDDVEHCIYILERHAPDSFDYQVLHAEFLDFGPEATNALVQVAAWMEDPKSAYALEMLSRGGFQLNPAQQRDLIEVWPRENVKAHAIVLGRMASPRVRAAAIDTLEHPDPKVRKQSRYLLSEVAKAQFKFPMRRGDYSKLLGAALKEPHPALIALLETYPAAQLRPAYARLLRSGDTATTSAVYEKLYLSDKENALQTLVGVIQDLEDDEISAALAISQMLQRRNEKRPDQFYLKFAKDLTEDAKLGLAGRTVGYDVWINAQALQSDKRADPSHLPDTPLNRSVFKYVVSNGKHSRSYVDYLGFLNSNNADPYIASLEASLGKTSDPIFVSKLGQFQSPLAKKVVAKAMNHPSDYHMISAAMFSAAKQEQIKLKQKMADLKSNHPISAVRVAADIALKELREPTPNVTSEKFFWKSSDLPSVPLLQAINKGENYCKVEGHDFKNQSRRMPYFKPYNLRNDIQASRSQLSAAAELKTGWLAGYDEGELGGGLVYFDYESQSAKTLLNGNIIAIIPMKAVPLGQHATSFWVITSASHMAMLRGALFRVTQINGDFKVDLQAMLPGPARNIAVSSDNSVAMDFVDRAHIKNPLAYNPPLLLEANGSIRRLCRNRSSNQTDATP